MNLTTPIRKTLDTQKITKLCDSLDTCLQNQIDDELNAKFSNDIFLALAGEPAKNELCRKIHDYVRDRDTI